MYQGKTSVVAKLWKSPGVDQIATIPAGTSVTGDAPRADGYVYLRSPRAGWTKKIWLLNYVLIVVPPPPPPAPDKTPFTLKVDGFQLFSGELTKE